MLDIEIKNPRNIVDTQLMFGCCKNLEIVNIRGIDFRGVKEAVGMFYGCMSLKEIMYDNLSSLKIKNMNFMFCECRSLENINEIYRELDFQKCEQAVSTFKGCNMLTAINLQLKDFRKLADARFMQRILLEFCISMVFSRSARLKRLQGQRSGTYQVQKSLRKPFISAG